MAYASELETKIGTYLRRRQSPEHDGWPLYHDGSFDISATIKATIQRISYSFSTIPLAMG